MCCYIFRLLIEKQFDDYGCVRSAFLRNHIAGCESCGSWFAAISGLGAGLHKNESCHLDQMQARIKAGLQAKLDSELLFRQRRYAFSPKRSVWAAAAAVVLFACLVSIPFMTKDNVVPGPVVSATDEDDLAEVVAIELPDAMTASFPSLGNVLDEYYQTELDEFTSQLKDTVTFFGDCIPQELIEL